jgi:HEAT repeat protein
VTSTEQLLLLLLGACALGWLAVALYTLLTRVLYDVGAAVVDRIMERGLSEALAGGPVDLDRLLRRLRRRPIERVAADTATSGETAVVFVARAMEHHSDLLLSAHPGGHRPRWERVAALRILARGRSEAAIPLLERALESEDEEVVAAAVATLGELGDLRSAELLVSALRRNVFGRSRIAAQLDVFREPVAGLLAPLLHDGESQLRFWGATLLRRYASDPAIDVELAAAARDSDPSVRAAAVESLTDGGGASALDAALILLDDPVWFVRAHAARAAASFDRGDLAARVAPLLADESWWVRAAAKEMLSVRHGAAPGVLIAYLDHDDEFARNGAAEVLQNIGALDALIRHVVVSGSDADLDTLRRVFAAGGSRLLATAAARNGLDAEQLEQLAEVQRDIAA